MNPIVKQLVSGDKISRFSHYDNKKLFYTVQNDDGKIYQFEIPTFDTGTTDFLPEFRAITLLRWIRKSDSDRNLIEVKEKSIPSYNLSTMKEAKFDHFCSENLYFNIDFPNGMENMSTYQFSININSIDKMIQFVKII